MRDPLLLALQRPIVIVAAIGDEHQKGASAGVLWGVGAIGVVRMDWRGER